MSISELAFFMVGSALDIMIIATIIFYSLKMLIKSEKHIPLLIVIIGIFCLFIIATILNLNVTLSFLLNISNWGIVIIVILFRDEIKSYLESVGSGRFLFNQINEDDVKYLDSLTSAVYKLSKSKTGALITLKREGPLHKYTQNAISLDANFSEYLLLSIFLKDSPIHDGAVVIEKDRIAYASTYFPISIDIDLDKKYGTRHRAGVTISKETDSLSIIVSEESGNVSIAFNGKLHSDVSEEFFRHYISEKVIEEHYE